MDSENAPTESDPLLPGTSTQDNDFILTLKETRYYKRIGNTNHFKVNLNLTKYWTNFSFNTVDKIAILSSGLYIFDIGSDGSLSYNFLHGANYTKIVANVTDKAITDFQCSQISQTYHNLTDQTTYTFTCFEQDMVWGTISLGIFAFTGASLWFFLQVGFNKKCWCQKLTYFLLWPFYVLFIKTASIFVDGQEDWKSANMRLTGIEGVFEAQAQFLLQLYIAFNRPDRELSTLQITSLTSSLVSIVLAKIEDHCALKPQTSIKTKASLFPMFLAFSIFVLGSTALMIATLRLYFVFIAVFCLIGLKLRECFASQMKTKSGKFIKLTIPMIFKAFLLIVVAILVNCFSSSLKVLTITALPFGDKPFTDEIYLSDVAIVKKMCYEKMSYFNIIFVVCLSSLALYLPLAYFQVVVPENKEEEEMENEPNV